MNILVCVTHVPDTTSKINFVNNNTQFDKTNVQYIIGPYDDYALARAVELKEQLGGKITVLNVGTVDSDATLRKALAIGADEAVRVNLDPTDSYVVAEEIAAVAREGAYDLILMGRESIDSNGGVVHGLVGEMLGIPSLSAVMKLEISDSKAILEKEIDGGKETVEVVLPAVFGCQEPISEWKIPNMRGIMGARSKPLIVKEPISSEGSMSLVSYELPPAKSGCKMVAADNVSELVRLLKEEAKIL